ncbi:hypothetical protein K458DRAFT_421480, partial [Lentithecium fluviatile CBS 122367]
MAERETPVPVPWFFRRQPHPGHGHPMASLVSTKRPGSFRGLHFANHIPFAGRHHPNSHWHSASFFM